MLSYLRVVRLTHLQDSKKNDKIILNLLKVIGITRAYRGLREQ